MCGNILITSHHFFEIITWKKDSCLQQIAKSEAVAKTMKEKDVESS